MGNIERAARRESGPYQSGESPSLQEGVLQTKGDTFVVASPVEFPESVINKPCHKFSEYALAWLSYYTDEMKRLQTVNHPNQYHFSRLIPRLENILKTTDFSILDDPHDVFVYCHQDFVMKNILVDHHCVTAVLDWEWSGPALPEFEIQTGFDFLQSAEDKTLFEKLMAERGFPHFFQSPPPMRQLFYELIGHLYALISCYEWIEGKLDHSAKFLVQKLEQRMVKKTKNFDIEKFANKKAEMAEQMLADFERAARRESGPLEPSQASYLSICGQELAARYRSGESPPLQEGVPQSPQKSPKNRQAKPIAFFGLSGVGKTTLAHGLVDLAPDQFFLVPITTSRLCRADDDLRYIEFLSPVDFFSHRDKGCFAMSWYQDGNYYGYRHEYFENTNKSPIMTCSLSAIQTLKEYGAVTVLIKGDGIKGLETRGSDAVIKDRSLLNKKNTEKYLNQTWFKKNVDMEYDQIWGDIPRSIQNLYHSLMEY